MHVLLSLALIFNLVVTSQKSDNSSSGSKPNFTGSWNARILKSDREPVSALKISYSDPKLEIWRMRTYQQPTIVMGQSLGTKASSHFVYYTDGRGETQKSIPAISGEPLKSKTERIADKFIITSVAKESDGKVNTDHTMTMEVSADGKSLTETVTLISESNTRRIVHLYDRIAGDATRNINGEWVQRISNRIVSLTIEHREPEIKVTRREVSETQDESEVAVYFTDGRGETNIQAGRRVKSVTKWKNETLVFALSSKSKIGGDTFELNETIKWQIGKDGESLVEVSQSKMAASGGFVIPPDPSTLVYARSAKPLPD